MGAAALAGPLALRRTGHAAAGPVDDALAFHHVGGPVVAVCGLTGGAGATTLAYLLACHAAHHSSSPVLLAELQAAGGLAALAQRSSPLGLADLARAVADQRPVAQPFAQTDDGLRLIAGAHTAAEDPLPPDALVGLLGDAHAAHGLVVVDTGRPSHQAAPVLEAASHVLYVLPATDAGVRRARMLADNGLFAQTAGSSTALVATALWPRGRAAVKQLRQLAEPLTDRLLLVPHSPDLLAGQLDRAAGQLAGTLTDLATILRPRPMTAPGSLTRLAATIALVTLAGSTATALAVSTLCATETRQLLDLELVGPVPQTGVLIDIAATNLRLAAAVLLAAWAVRWRPQLRSLLDPILVCLLVLNSVLLGAGLGAYGQRLLEAIAFHVPLELAGFAVAGAAYLAARAGQLTNPTLAVAAAASALLLAAAATVETLNSIGANR